MMSTWFNDRVGHTVCVMRICDTNYSVFKVVQAKTDYVRLENALTVVDNVPYSSIIQFRDPLA